MSTRKDLMMYFGLGVSLFGVILYDPLGLLFKGMGLMVIGLGLICMFVSYQYPSEIEMVNKVVEKFERK